MATKAHHAVVPSADVDMQMESTSPSSHETSITIDECSEMKGKAPTSFRWDMVFLMYILSIAFTALTFAGSYNATYSPLLICFGFWHFGFESSLSIYFTYSGKGAVFASRVVLGICFVQGALALVFTDAMTTIFSLEFIASDSFSAISSVCLMFNQSMPTRFKVLPFAVSLHFIGVSLKICMLPTELFESDKVPQHGANWFYIVTVAVLQIWLCRGVLSGKFNDIGRVTYDRTKNSAFFIAFCKIGAPLISFMLLPAVLFILVSLRTVEDSGNNQFASGIWDDIMLALGWPISMFAILWALYIVATAVTVGRELKLKT